MAIHIEPFESPLGAEINGVDLAGSLTEDEFTSIEVAWNAHSVLVFRDQDLSPEALIEFSRRFGELEVHVLDQYLHPDHPEILVVSNILENDRHIGIYDAGRYWHTDLSYLSEPSRGSILHAIEIPKKDGETLGDTLWTSTAAAYEALDPALKEQLAGLKAAFDLAKRFQRLVADGDQQAVMSERQKDLTPQVAHPIIRTHPVTGRKCIYVNEAHSTHIVDYPETLSRALLDQLWAHCIEPRFIYRHRWRPGDVVMWDNVPTQHLAIHDYELPQRRRLHRTTLRGGRPF